MRKSRCKYKCINCGLPITKATKRYNPEAYRIFKGRWIHAVRFDGSYFFMCDMYSKDENLRNKYAEI